MNGIPEGYPGFCAICILNLNAAFTPYIGDENTGLAKDMEDKMITLPNGMSLKWKKGAYIPAGSGWLTGIFMLFGESADLRRPGTRERIRPYAVTMNDGKLVCDECNAQLTHIRPGRW